MDCNKFDREYAEVKFHIWLKEEHPEIIFHKSTAGYDKVYKLMKEVWYAAYEQGLNNQR